MTGVSRDLKLSIKTIPGVFGLLVIVYVSIHALWREEEVGHLPCCKFKVLFAATEHVVLWIKRST